MSCGSANPPAHVPGLASKAVFPHRPKASALIEPPAGLARESEAQSRQRLKLSNGGFAFGQERPAVPCVKTPTKVLLSDRSRLVEELGRIPTPSRRQRSMVYQKTPEDARSSGKLQSMDSTQRHDWVNERVDCLVAQAAESFQRARDGQRGQDRAVRVSCSRSRSRPHCNRRSHHRSHGRHSSRHSRSSYSSLSRSSSSHSRSNSRCSRSSSSISDTSLGNCSYTTTVAGSSCASSPTVFPPSPTSGRIA